jgi:signal transduction histidine kinase
MVSSVEHSIQPARLFQLWVSLKTLPIKYPAIISGYIIYSYLFMTMIRFFIIAKHTHITVWDAFEIFDALPFMWLLALTLVKVIEIRTKLHESETQRALKERELQIRETQLKTMHDLKNPFAAISGFGTILHNDAALKTMPEQREIVKYIIDAGQSALTLINDIFDSNAIQSGLLRINKSHFVFAQMIESAVKTHRLAADEKHITITIDAESSTLPDVVFGDVNRIRQALDNLLSNAIKYSYPRTHIIVRLSRDTVDLKIEVIDQGQGIPEEEMRFLFDEYSHISVRPTAGETSTGLGLGIVKKIISGHGGAVGATSVPGKGSNFYFTLPIGDGDKAAKE